LPKCEKESTSARLNTLLSNIRRIAVISLFVVVGLGSKCPPQTSCLTTPPVGPPCLAEDSTDQALLNVFKPERLQVINPCLTVTGTLKLAWREQDGDLHLNIDLDPQFADVLSDGANIPQGCMLVAEIIPADQPGCAPGTSPPARGGTGPPPLIPPCPTPPALPTPSFSPPSSLPSIGEPVDAETFGTCSCKNLSPPPVGSHVSLSGPLVRDIQHAGPGYPGWLEIHPVKAITVVTP
jgi:hypothetical protein